MAGTALSLCLLLAAALRGALTQRPGPPLLRLRRLEEQVRRLQEVTLNHLQSIARNYNISYNIDGRFQALAEQAEAASTARAALGAELARLATAGRRLHRRLKRLEGTVGALSTPHLPVTSPSGALVDAGTQLHDATLTRDRRLEWAPQGRVAPSTPSLPKARRRQQWWQEGRLWLPADARPGPVPREDAEPAQDTAPRSQAVAPRSQAVAPRSQAVAPVLPTVPQKQPAASEQPAEGRYGPPAPAAPSPACRAGAVLLFPNTSAEHKAILGLGPRQGLRDLSFCAWLATPAPHLGALLSYASKDSGSELALGGHVGSHPGSVRFVIGDREFRELPVTPLLDGKWHHLCLSWSSAQGQYRFYVDRRLLAAGSGFQQGYQIPTGGLLVLGREQDPPGRDLGPVEAFVGHLADFALWNRALLPGEVASMATGHGLPHAPLLTLSDASLQGEVQGVTCPCLGTACDQPGSRSSAGSR